MTIEVLWTPAELDQLPVYEFSAVVVDVLRAGTCVATAIHHGARSIVPAASTEAALRIANALGRHEVLLCGERQGERIEGFDLGNSPAEFSVEAVDGRTIVMTTTNGTRALTALAGAPTAYVAAFVNLGAVARALSESEGNVLIVCAGRSGRVSAADALCAGLLVEAYLDVRRKRKPNAGTLGDGAVAALALAREHAPVSAEFLRATAGGRALELMGHGADIETCARIDSVPVVPVYRKRQVTRLDGVAVSSAGARKRSG